MGYKIEKGVPMPEKTLAATLRSIDIGDSIFIQGKKHSHVSGSVSNPSVKKTGFKFTIRKVENGVRIWRIA